jgi:glucan 1,3-beta-glucosidase
MYLPTMQKPRRKRILLFTSNTRACGISSPCLSTWLAAALVLFLLSTTERWSVDGRLYGVNYSIRNGPDWEPDETRCKSNDQVKLELQQLQTLVTDRIRVFSMTDCNTAEVVLSLTAELGMKVWLGFWVGQDQLGFDNERARFLELIDLFDFTENVVGIHVSSEAIYRGEITVDQAIALRNIVKSDLETKGWTDLPVTVADVIDTSIEFPALITLDPAVVSFNQFPFWEETVNISMSAQYMNDRVQLVTNQAGGRQVIVTETGWADAGSNPSANAANPASMAKWYNEFVCLANSKGWWYYWFDAYDSDWRRLNEQTPNDVEGHFGKNYMLYK